MKVTRFHGLLVVALSACSRQFIDAPAERVHPGVAAASWDGKSSRAVAGRVASSPDGLDWNSGYGGALPARTKGNSSMDDGLGVPPVAQSRVPASFGCVVAGPARVRFDPPTRELDPGRTPWIGRWTACGHERLPARAAPSPWSLAGPPSEMHMMAIRLALELSDALRLNLGVPLLLEPERHGSSLTSGRDGWPAPRMAPHASR